MAKQTKEKKTQKKKRSKFNSFLYILMCAVIVGSFLRLIYIQAEQYNALRLRHENILEDYARARAQYYALNYQIAHFDSDAYIERLARDRLGWVRPNEIVFRQRTE